MPDSIDPQIIQQDETHRFITDKERIDWSNKASRNLATESLDGIMSKYDKIKLNTIETNAKLFTFILTHMKQLLSYKMLLIDSLLMNKS